MRPVAKILSRLVEYLPRKITFVGINGAYLTRYRVFDTEMLKLVVHNFHRPDEDIELHNHPWYVAVAFVLSGGYEEERRVEGRIIRRRIPFVNVIWADTFHRIDKLDDDTWTIMLTGPRVQDWGFWDRVSGTYMQWQDFIRSKGLNPI